jgi:hypothetical protein
MAVEIRDPRDVSTILRVLFFMGFCNSVKQHAKHSLVHSEIHHKQR